MNGLKDMTLPEIKRTSCFKNLNFQGKTKLKKEELIKVMKINFPKNWKKRVIEKFEDMKYAKRHLGDKSFFAYSRAIDVIKNDKTNNADEIFKQKFIGKTMKENIIEILKTGTLKELEELCKDKEIRAKISQMRKKSRSKY